MKGLNRKPQGASIEPVKVKLFRISRLDRPNSPLRLSEVNFQLALCELTSRLKQQRSRIQSGPLTYPSESDLGWFLLQ